MPATRICLVIRPFSELSVPAPETQMVLAVGPIIEPARVDAQGSKVRGQFGSEGYDAAFTNAHRTNVRFSRAGWGVDVVLVDADAAG